MLVVIASAIVVVYSGYRYYSIGNGTEAPDIIRDNGSTSINETGNNTTNNYTDTDIPGLNETDNRTNRSTISIPLEKPPFID